MLGNLDVGDGRRDIRGQESNEIRTYFTWCFVSMEYGVPDGAKELPRVEDSFGDRIDGDSGCPPNDRCRVRGRADKNEESREYTKTHSSDHGPPCPAPTRIADWGRGLLACSPAPGSQGIRSICSHCVSTHGTRWDPLDLKRVPAPREEHPCGPGVARVHLPGLRGKSSWRTPDRADVAGKCAISGAFNPREEALQIASSGRHVPTYHHANIGFRVGWDA